MTDLATPPDCELALDDDNVSPGHNIPIAAPLHDFTSAPNGDRGFILTVNDVYFWDLYRRGDVQAVAQTHFYAATLGGNTLGTLVGVLPPFEIIRHVNLRSDRSATSALITSAPGVAPAYFAVADLYADKIVLTMGSQALADCNELIDRAKSALETPRMEPTRVPFDVFTENETWGNTRSFEQCPWESIEQNYPTSTRSGLARMMAMTQQDFVGNSGKIILFHGRPGTGKTWAIRSLLTAWRGWAEGAIVADAEALFGSPSYMLSVLKEPDGKSLRVVILEDADDVVRRHDSRGPGVARLLSLTDGMISAASNVVVLITTNAPPESLDQAITRPGRCVATIGFDPFSADEATVRLEGKAKATYPLTLAEIYERLGAITKIDAGTPVPSSGQYL